MLVRTTLAVGPLLACSAGRADIAFNSAHVLVVTGFSSPDIGVAQTFELRCNG